MLYFFLLSYIRFPFLRVRFEAEAKFKVSASVGIVGEAIRMGAGGPATSQALKMQGQISSDGKFHLTILSGQNSRLKLAYKGVLTLESRTLKGKSFRNGNLQMVQIFSSHADDNNGADKENTRVDADDQLPSPLKKAWNKEEERVASLLAELDPAGFWNGNFALPSSQSSFSLRCNLEFTLLPDFMKKKLVKVGQQLYLVHGYGQISQNTGAAKATITGAFVTNTSNPTDAYSMLTKGTFLSSICPSKADIAGFLRIDSRPDQQCFVFSIDKANKQLVGKNTVNQADGSSPLSLIYVPAAATDSIGGVSVLTAADAAPSSVSVSASASASTSASTVKPVNSRQPLGKVSSQRQLTACNQLPSKPELVRYGAGQRLQGQAESAHENASLGRVFLQPPSPQSAETFRTRAARPVPSHSLSPSAISPQSISSDSSSQSDVTHFAMPSLAMSSPSPYSFSLPQDAAQTSAHTHYFSSQSIGFPRTRQLNARNPPTMPLPPSQQQQYDQQHTMGEESIDPFLIGLPPMSVARSKIVNAQDHHTQSRPQRRRQQRKSPSQQELRSHSVQYQHQRPREGMPQRQHRSVESIATSTPGGDSEANTFRTTASSALAITNKQEPAAKVPTIPHPFLVDSAIDLLESVHIIDSSDSDSSHTDNNHNDINNSRSNRSSRNRSHSSTSSSNDGGSGDGGANASNGSTSGGSSGSSRSRAAGAYGKDQKPFAKDQKPFAHLNPAFVEHPELQEMMKATRQKMAPKKVNQSIPRSRAKNQSYREVQMKKAVAYTSRVCMYNVPISMIVPNQDRMSGYLPQPNLPYPYVHSSQLKVQPVDTLKGCMLVSCGDMYCVLLVYGAFCTLASSSMLHLQ